MTKTLSTLALILLVVASVACFLPWGWHPAASLSPNAPDLAEWTTLYPPNHQGPLPLLPSFALRLAMGLLVMVIVLCGQVQARMISPVLRWGALIVGAALTATLLPPLEFLSNLGDANYRQQMLLAVITVVGAGLIGWQANRLPERWIWLLAAGLAGLAGGVGLLGLLGGLHLFEQLARPLAPGLGGILFVLSLLVYTGLSLYRLASPPRITAQP